VVPPVASEDCPNFNKKLYNKTSIYFINYPTKLLDLITIEILYYKENYLLKDYYYLVDSESNAIKKKASKKVIVL